MTSNIKKVATQLVGISVSKTPRKTLVDLYSQTLSILGSMPASSVYRLQTEEITRKRLETVQNEENVILIEEKINCGQIEEVIIQAKDELSLAEKIIEFKPWEPLNEVAPPGQWA
ncbi:NADH dehydrogenase [ubiquinone] 1 alpha subcomplex subunit 5 [Hydra vulgaris]|uniref:NADH dehydrogenase [ubiquinone] 1 alpha subcomplex subunit 5 n=1 Tax=Hydra vulgaris TaxID=6087 RepID=T2MCJ8_HYDVU|nr:NADH dehydrogenase [ubiquinone] 1 alpha subcomplex subunit 5-like [Hydra vulgaris]